MWWRRVVTVTAALSILIVDATPAAQHLLRLPSRITIAAGQSQTLPLDLPGSLAVRGSGGSGLRVDERQLGASWSRLPGRALTLLPAGPGLFVLHMRLFGVLPWRALRVEAVAVPEVYASGQSVGVVLRSRAPLVVGLAGGRWPLLGNAPAARAGLRRGDYILAVNGTAVSGAADLAQAVQRAGASGQAVQLLVLRGGQRLHLTVRPERVRGTYLLGVWVRDRATGIGTMTFMSQSRYGALGHAVTDSTTGVPVLLGSGSLFASQVSSVQPSRDGRPGEKVGALISGAPPLGSVTDNTEVGIFGRLLQPLAAAILSAHAIPVALEDQVHVGPAQLLTVLHGTSVASYAVRIDAVLPQRRAASKGLVLTVTDPALLASTGGIVQGMSGSPILQDGRLVGAVTHVLVDNPQRGYGVLAIWMTQAAGLGEQPARGV